MAYRKLEYLKSKDLHDVKAVCKLVLDREVFKKELLLLETQLFDHQLGSCGVSLLGDAAGPYLSSALGSSTFEPVG